MIRYYSPKYLWPNRIHLFFPRIREKIFWHCYFIHPCLKRWHLSVRMPSPYTRYSHPFALRSEKMSLLSQNFIFPRFQDISYLHPQSPPYVTPPLQTPPPPFPHPPPHTLKPGVGNKYWSVYVCTYSWCACAWGFLGGRGGAIWATHGELPHPPPRVLVPRGLLLG